MRASKKHNNFTNETHFKFMDDNYWECWWCGMNHADCGHHIFGRGKSEGCEKSPLNYAPLSNHYCHLPIHGVLTTTAGKKFLFEKTLDFLERIGYTLTEEDNEFLEKYAVEIYKIKHTNEKLVIPNLTKVAQRESFV